MSNTTVQAGGNGIGFGGLLAILFIGLKLGGVIDWSWLWVLSPLWIPLAIGLAIGAIVLSFFAVAAVIGAIAVYGQKRKRQNKRRKDSEKRRSQQ